MRQATLSLFVLLAFAAGMPANADTFTSTVVSIMSYASGDIDVMFMASPASCTESHAPKHFRIPTGTVGQANMHSDLLFAASGEKSVSITFDDTSSTCNITAVRVL
jgi:hypothetical protein